MNISTENIILFEQITNIKAQKKLNKPIFIIETPITLKEDYGHFQIFPISKKYIYFAKYVFLTENEYISTNTACKRITGTHLLCEEQNRYNMQKNQPCEVRLLKYKKNNTTCKIIPGSLTGSKRQKFLRNKFLVRLPNKNCDIPTKKGQYIDM